MKTYLFGAFDPNERGNEQFLDDFSRLVSIWTDGSKQPAFRAQVPDLLLAKTNIVKKQALDKLAQSMSEQVLTIDSAVDCANFLIRRLITKDCQSDQPGDLASALQEKKLIDESQVEAISEMMGWLKNEVLPQVESELRTREAASGLFPSMTGVSVEVQLRAVQRDSYDSTKDINEYSPTIDALVPVASIEIRTTDDDHVFQAGELDISILINYLQSALKDIESLKQCVSDKRQVV